MLVAPLSFQNPIEQLQRKQMRLEKASEIGTWLLKSMALIAFSLTT
jgi:hypothetical protein